MSYPKKIDNLVQAISLLPGFGKKSSERFVFNILKLPNSNLINIIDSLNDIKDLRICKKCNSFADSDFCKICLDPSRDKSLLCVVENYNDLVTLENSGIYNGYYFILNKLISTAKDYTSQDIDIESLEKETKNIKELIIAFNPSVDSETTCLFIKEYFKNSNFIISRIAMGVPMGGSIELSDPYTILKSLENRTKI